MNFELLSTAGVLLGVAILAAGLWLLQRLRVQHREVEVQTTLFWQAALEETRARVFTKRFRHWPAWLLLVAIASLLWMLFAGPQRWSSDGTQHVVLLDWSVEDETVRSDDLAAAMDLARTLPANRREIIAVSTKLETLLKPNEPIDVARLRATESATPAPAGVNWALETLASRASADRKVAAYVIGDATVDELRLAAVNSSGVSVSRVPRQTALEPAVQLSTFGVSDSTDTAWSTVDVWFEFATAEPVNADRISITQAEQPLTASLVTTESGRFELRNIAADGSILNIAVDGDSVGSMTLPTRTQIRVGLEPGVPAVIRDLVELDPACEVVTTDADVTIGTSEAATLQLTNNETAAFEIWTDTDADPTVAMASIVDELALRQIDATGLAEKSGEVIGIELHTGEKRKVTIWQSLFTPAFDFRESRSCPIVVSRAIRWLANNPPIVEWASVGERLPADSPTFARADAETTVSGDGRSFSTTLLKPPTGSIATIPTTDVSAVSSGFNAFTLLGLLVVGLLLIEWILFQRGHMP